LNNIDVFVMGDDKLKESNKQATIYVKNLPLSYTHQILFE